MKFVYRGNVLNFHTLPLAKALHDLLGDDFCFISEVESVEKSKKANDRDDASAKYDWAINLNGNDEEQKLANRRLEEADVVLTLEAYVNQFSKRLKDNRVTFFYSERIFRSWIRKPWNIRMVRAFLWNHKRFNRKRAYMLCNSAYLPWDLHWYRIYKNRFYKWGYFPELSAVGLEKIRCEKWGAEIASQQPVRIIWVGRLSQDAKLKKPEYALRLAQVLYNKNITFELTIIGDGDCKEDLKKLAERLSVSQYVSFVGAISNTEVRQYMCQAHLMLFTSNRDEGWGAVLNEAMNAGCCCIASETAGATRFLIKDGYNGLVYHNDNVDEMCQKVLGLIDDFSEMQRLGENAYKTIVEEWNAKVAAKRLVEFSNNIIENKKEMIYLDGPMSKAEVVRG